MSWCWLSTAVLCNAIGSVVIKKYIDSVDRFIFRDMLFSEFSIGAGFFGLGLMFYSLSLRNLDLSTAYIFLIACSSMLVVLASVVLFHEEFTLFKGIGLFMVIIGLSLLNIKIKV